MFDDARIEKYIFRKAFSGLLSDDILWRRKEAFSDGVSGHERSWFQIIRDYIDTKVTNEEYNKYKEFIEYTHVCNAPYDKESFYYRTIFEKLYPSCEKAFPYFWRHPFCEEKDPSARLLTCYKTE
jgi:asparagine synthase (glutamine-hydrolysing)